MTAQIFHVSSVRGDDQLGDGSVERPVATLDRACDLAGKDSVIAYDGLLGTMVPTPVDEANEPELSFEAKAAVILALTLGLWGLIFLTVMNPRVGLLVAAIVAVILVAVFDEDDDQDQPRRGHRQNGRAKP